jgi:hypothetical protein
MHIQLVLPGKPEILGKYTGINSYGLHAQEINVSQCPV